MKALSTALAVTGALWLGAASAQGMGDGLRMNGPAMTEAEMSREDVAAMLDGPAPGQFRAGPQP